MIETWSIITGWNDSYSISSIGRVKRNNDNRILKTGHNPNRLYLSKMHKKKCDFKFVG